MSKLDKLIAELCPNGVEYKRLKDVATITRGGSFQKKDYEESGFPCIHYGQIYTLYGLFVEETASFIGDMVAAKQKKAVTNDIIMAVTSENIEDVCKCVAWLGDGEVAVSGHTAIIHHTLDPKYLVYYLHSSMFYSQKVKLAHGTKVIEVKPDSLGEIRLPVPPLEVQREIVRMLDNFTFLTAELTAELTARRKQYEHYRNDNLSFGKETDWRTIGEIFDIRNGYTPSKKIPEYWENGSIPWFRLEDIRTNGRVLYDAIQHVHISGIKKSGLFKKDSIMIATTATLGEHAIIKTDYMTNQQLTNLTINDDYRDRMLPKFAFYYFYIIDELCKSVANYSGGIPIVDQNKFRLLPFPVPSIEKQEEIVALLDKFDSLCNDISIGLPAEIAARQKQYEYYRDKLLTFKELNE